MSQVLQCPHCEKTVFRKSTSGASLKTRTTIMVLHKSGEIEVNCVACKRAIILPMQFRASIELRKAVFTIPKT